VFFRGILCRVSKNRIRSEPEPRSKTLHFSDGQFSSPAYEATPRGSGTTSDRMRLHLGSSSIVPAFFPFVTFYRRLLEAQTCLGHRYPRRAFPPSQVNSFSLISSEISAPLPFAPRFFC
jgi:hypothetical protein